MAIVQNFQQLTASAGTAEEALRKLAKAQKEVDFAAMKPGIMSGVASLEEMKKKLEELTPAANKAHGSLTQLRSVGHFMRMGGLASHTHALTEMGSVLRGLSFMGAGALPVIGGVAVAIGTVGVAAVMCSSNLQDSLGRALFITKEQAEATAKSLQHLKRVGESIGLARSMGGATLDELHQQRAVSNARAPGLARQGQLQRDQVRQGAHAQAMVQFQDRAFNPTHESLEEMHAKVRDRGGPDRGHDESKLLDPNDIRGLAAKKFQVPGLLARQQFENQAAMQGEQKTAGELRAKRDKLTEQQAATEKIGEFNQRQRKLGEISQKLHQIKDATGFAVPDENGNVVDQGVGGMAKNVLRDAIPLTRRTHAGQKEGESAEQAEARIFRESLENEKRTLEKQQQAAAADVHKAQQRFGQGGGGDPAKVAEEQRRNEKEIEQSQERQRKIQEEQLRIKQQIGKADVENLKTIQATAAEQLKLAQAERRQAESNLRGAKISIGGMGKRDIRASRTILAKMKAGQDLTDEELQHAESRPELREHVDEYKKRQFEKDPEAKAYADEAGFNKKVADAKNREQDAAKLNVDLKTDVQAKIDINSKEMAEQIKNSLVPIITQAFKDAVIQAAQAVGAAVREIKLKEGEAAANKRAASG